MSDLSPLDFDDFFPVCGYPSPSATDLEAWNALEVDAATDAELSLGLFGYDITCLVSKCT